MPQFLICEGRGIHSISLRALCSQRCVRAVPDRWWDSCAGKQLSGQRVGQQLHQDLPVLQPTCVSLSGGREGLGCHLALATTCANLLGWSQTLSPSLPPPFSPSPLPSFLLPSLLLFLASCPPSFPFSLLPSFFSLSSLHFSPCCGPFSSSSFPVSHSTSPPSPFLFLSPSYSFAPPALAVGKWDLGEGFEPF